MGPGPGTLLHLRWGAADAAAASCRAAMRVVHFMMVLTAGGPGKKGYSFADTGESLVGRVEGRIVAIYSTEPSFCTRQNTDLRELTLKEIVDALRQEGHGGQGI